MDSNSFSNVSYPDAEESSSAENSAAGALREYAPSELVDEILLSTVEGVGAVTMERLLKRFGSASATFKAPLSELIRVEKVGENVAKRVVDAAKNADAEAIVRFCEENEILVLTPRDSRYPERLRTIATPPQILYLRGELKREDRRAISIVGTRAATTYGRAQTMRLARELAEAGFTIVSGLALGIDGCAHRAALDAKGRTIAVLGGGVAKIYPREHEDLAARIMTAGAVVSEYHPLMTPLAGNFPARNRIVSGLSVGVLVIESGKRGGSMITARLAAEQNRDLYAVPGPVDNPVSQGCHELIRDGAILVETVDDILNSLPAYELARPQTADLRRRDADDRIAEGTAGISERSISSIARPSKVKKARTEPVRKKAALESQFPDSPTSLNEQIKRFPPLSDVERAIVDGIGDKKVSIDELIRIVKLPASNVLGAITALEFKKVLRRLPGNAVARL